VRQIADRQTDVTYAGYFIICSMLCYSNGTNIVIIILFELCQEYFSFELPSIQLGKRKKKIETKFVPNGLPYVV